MVICVEGSMNKGSGIGLTWRHTEDEEKKVLICIPDGQ